MGTELRRPAPRRLVGVVCAAAVLLAMSAPAGAFRPPPLSAPQEKDLRANFALCVGKLKGPYTENTCVCQDGTKLAVRSASGAIRVPCKAPIFCAAFRAPWAEALGKQRMWIANIFSRDLYLWDSFPDHNDLVRGYILEKYFIDTHPNHKLSQLRSFGGLSGAEYETPAAPRFFERYLSAPDFNDLHDFLLAYELQKRFYVRDDLGQIEKVRTMSVRVQNANPKFKPLRDAIHNQLSAGLIPQLVTFRDQLPAGATRQQVDDIITQVTKLTTLDESALAPLVAQIQDAALRERLSALIPQPSAEPVGAITALAQVMVLARQTVAARSVSPADARRLIDLDIAAAQVIQSRGGKLLDSNAALSAKQSVELLAALTDATYGVGLLSERERGAAQDALHALLAHPTQPRAEFARNLKQAERIVEWAQANATLAFAEVWAPWTLVLPATAGIGDDILRGSPLLLYAQVARRLDDYVAGAHRIRHELFGVEVDADVRALNPGLALGRLRVAPKDGAYTRDEIVALPETPADLEPAAGILTEGEGNVLSHVQLLARALGIPNVVLGPSAYQRIKSHDGQQVFLIVTPHGRVIIDEAAKMTPAERAVYEDYTRNTERTGNGSLQGGAQKLHIDRSRIDLTQARPIDLTRIRRSDSGRICGPKGAFLGELKQTFPDHVARGVVVPFGAYYEHYQNATVQVPANLRALGIATPGERLPDFVERTYREFFDVLIPAKKSDKELSAWITPRLEIIQHSIRAAPLATELKQTIRESLDRLGLLKRDDPSQTVGCFVRSDTNVEDLDSFNGAGLNLTIFNLKSLDDIYEGLKEVWASPFTFRSFSWRQTLIDDPLWVLPSVVILESVPSEKSGVLVTADPDTGDRGKMIVATSEGVGGAVDGTSAETLLWSPQKVDLITLFKSPWRNQLQPGGGSKIVPATGKETVLEPQELKDLIAAGQKITETFEPARDASGRPRPWDIEFGFTAGKLWLFQCRPFIGNDELKNIPALATLETTSANQGSEMLSLEEIVR
jgi:hypothetical protein